MSLLSRVPKLPAEDDTGAAPASQTREINAVLGRGSSFEGKLVFEGTVRISGAFSGEIRSNDTLVVEDGGRVQGDIHVGTLIVSGEIHGVIRASRVVEMHAPARVFGQIFTPSLLIDRGVIFEGTTKMEKLDAK